MKQHEREYFISRIRSGIYKIKKNGLELKIYQPSIEQQYDLNEIYIEAYNEALNDDFKTEEEMLEWMREKEIWTNDDDVRYEGLKKDIEKLKVEIYKSRNNQELKEKIRKYLRAGEEQFAEQNYKKNQYYSNTCESIAVMEKSFAFLKMCTHLNDKPFNFESITIDEIFNDYYSMILNERKIRELTRNEPWRSLWSLSSTKNFELFANKDQELSIDQKNILVWSKMYDNVYESLDCPSDDVIEDDDMLDGWFLIQRDKRKKERGEQELNQLTSNDKIKNSSEIFLMSGKTKKDINRIHDMNDISSKTIKKQREELIKKKGAVGQNEFFDEKVNLNKQSNEIFKGNFRR